tara:strand:+ start:837 stop:5177 length:4341 start_codon:yes stop_codon:yes gene_type:complete
MADKPFVPIPVEVNTNKDTFVPIPYDPKTERNPTGSILYEIADNIIGFDDGYDTMVERVTKPIGEAGEGLISGGIGILEGIGGLVSLVPDLVVGSDLGGAIDRGGDKLRESLNINPEGIAGKGTEFVTQYLAPGLGAVNIASKVGKAARVVPKTKSEKFGQFVKDGAIFAGVETIVADDQASTVIGDWLGFDPAKTTDLIGLEGREAAMARLLNKAKIFAESNVLGGAIGSALYGAGKGGQALARTETGQTITQKASGALNAMAKNIDETIYKRMTDPDSQSAFANNLAGILAFGRYRGYLPDRIAEQRLRLDPKIQNDLFKAENILKDVDKEIKVALNNLPSNQGALTDVYFINRIDDYLLEKDAGIKARILSELPQNVRQPVIRMRKHVDSLSNDILKSDFLKQAGYVTPDGLNVEDVIQKGLGSYLRRNYKIYTDSKYTPTEESVKAADDFFTRNRKYTEDELTTLAKTDVFDKKFTPDFILRNNITVSNKGTEAGAVKINGEVTQELAELARKSFLDRHTVFNHSGYVSGGKSGIQRVARDKLDTGIFVTRTELPKTLRALMGEVKDPREAYLTTIADLSQFKAVDEYFGTIANLSKESPLLRELFIDGQMVANNKFLQDDLIKKGYVQLGTGDAQSIAKQVGQQDEMFKRLNQQGWGQLDGYYVPKDIYNDLTRFIANDDTLGARGIKYLANAFLRGKALSQYSKTVLSPITQIRNLITAGAFATANGNIPVFGRGGSLRDATVAVTANIRRMGDEGVLRELEDARRRGILGTNTELREIQDSLRKGIITSQRDMANQDGMSAILGESMAKKVRSAPGVTTALKGTKLAEEFYQGADDLWKFYSYQAEIAKLKYALEGVDDATKINYLTKGNKDLDPDTLSILRRAKDTLQGDRIRSASMVDPQFARDIGLNKPISQGGYGVPKFNFDEFPGLYDTLIKDRAAQIVRDTVPNYNKAASNLVSTLRRLPFGNFIVFPMEIYRTSFNIMRQALDDMASDIAGIRARGRQRMLGLLGTTIAVPTAAKEIMHQITGVTREEMEAYQQSAGAPWERGATLLPLGMEDGKLSYVNFSTLNPYDTISRSIVRLLRETDKAEQAGSNTEEVFRNVMGGALYEFAEPFISEAMLTEAMVDAFIQNETATGAKIYLNSDQPGDKLGKQIAHVINTVVPNFVPFTFEKLNPLSPFETKVEPKKVIRGTVGQIAPDFVSPKNKIGREFGPKQLISSLFGVSPQEFDIKEGFKFKAYEMSQLQKEAKTEFSSLTDDANISSGQLFDAFVSANNNKLRADRRYYQIIQDFKELGLSEDDIGSILKKNKIGGALSILNGEFTPYRISRDDIRKLGEKGTLNLLPEEAISQVQESMAGISLDPEATDFNPIPVEPPKPKPEPFIPIPMDNNDFVPIPMNNDNFVPIPMSSTTNPNIRTNPIIVGDNPNTQTIAKITG